MSFHRHLIVIVVLGALSLARDGRGAAQGPETKPASPSPAAQAIAAATAREIGQVQVFAADRPGWTTTDAGYGGAADGNWTYAMAAHDGAPDYRLSATVALKKPAGRQDGMELGSFAVFNNLANLGGYEAGVILRISRAATRRRCASAAG
jgi:hypothetical protein